MPARSNAIWGIRDGRDGEAAALFERGYVAVGWLAGDLANLPPTREAFKERLAKEYPRFEPGTISANGGVLYRFVHELNVGDAIVYRPKLKMVVMLGRITGPYEYSTELEHLVEPGWAHLRRTQWLRTIQLAQLTPDARSMLGFRATLIQFRTGTDALRRLLPGE